MRVKVNVLIVVVALLAGLFTAAPGKAEALPNDIGIAGLAELSDVSSFNCLAIAKAVVAGGTGGLIDPRIIDEDGDGFSDKGELLDLYRYLDCADDDTLPPFS